MRSSRKAGFRRSDGTTNVFEALGSLEGWQQGVADLQYKRIRQVADEECSRKAGFRRSDGTTNVFEALGSLEGWQQGVADLQYKRIRQVADEECSRKAGFRRSDGTTNVFEALGSLEGWQQGVADLQYKRIRQVADEECSRKAGFRRSDGTTNVFEALGSLEGWQQGVADLQYKRIRQVADEEWSGAESSTVAKRRRVLHVVVYEAWAAGLYDDDEPAGFVSTAAILTGLTYGSLLECAMMDGIDGMPSEVPVKFRSAAKKWFRCSEQREKERDARRDDQRAARAKDQPLSILDVADQVAVYGLVHLPKALTPSHTDLNSFQRRVEREPDVALPYVDISKDPYTPATAGWTSRGPVPFVHTVCALHRFLVIASLTGAFGTQPWPVIFGYPALVGDLAAKFGCAVAREYDEKVRRSFASVRRAAPRTPLLIEAVERLLTLGKL
ncbi:hypothetical protein DIPPA_35781 [Diplonema papillatum]|nr:hypothetical protein DIPPA_35781 [Diplonema papillatum]